MHPVETEWSPLPCICLQVADNAEPMAKEFNEQQLQPAAEYIAKNFEKEARRLAKEVGPLAEGLPRAMRRAVELNKVTPYCLPYVYILVSGLHLRLIAQAASPSRCTYVLCSASMWFICCGHLS